MENHIVQRKLIATYVAVMFLAMGMTVAILNEGEASHYGYDFALMTFSFGIYSGVIIAVYGNLVSLFIECVLPRWFKLSTWFFILLHGIFGLIFILSPILALWGGLAAVIYAVTDRRVLHRKNKDVSIRMFWLIPAIVFSALFLFFTIITPPQPPFTAEDAIELATEGSEGTDIEMFPREAGVVSKGDVTRETSVKEIGDEVYIVTFTETWKQEDSGGPWSSTYKVERGSVSAYKTSTD